MDLLLLYLLGNREDKVSISQLGGDDVQITKLNGIPSPAHSIYLEHAASNLNVGISDFICASMVKNLVKKTKVQQAISKLFVRNITV